MSYRSTHYYECDRCRWWDHRSMGGTRAEATSGAKASGWVITRDKHLCAPCARVEEEERTNG